MRLGIDGSDLLYARRRSAFHFPLHRLRDILRDLGLEAQDVPHLALVGSRQQVRVGRGVQQLDADPHAVALRRHRHRARDHGLDPQLLRDPRQLRRGVGVAGDRRAGDHAEAGHPGQLVDDLVVKLAGEQIVFALREVRERQDGDRGDRRFGIEVGKDGKAPGPGHVGRTEFGTRSASRPERGPPSADFVVASGHEAPAEPDGRERHRHRRHGQEGEAGRERRSSVLPRACFGRVLRSPQPFRGQLVGPRDGQHHRQPQRHCHDQRLQRPVGRVEGRKHDLAQLQRNERRNSVDASGTHHLSAAQFVPEGAEPGLQAHGVVVQLWVSSAVSKDEPGVRPRPVRPPLG